MKEKEFNEELKKLGLDGGIKISVYYHLDEDGDVCVDTDSMREEFNIEMNKIEGSLK